MSCKFNTVFSALVEESKTIFPKIWPVSVDETLMFVFTVFLSCGPSVNAAGLSTIFKSPIVANSIVIFNGTHLHYGTTQTDTNKRIVLNTNIRKAEVDPFGPPDENGRQEFEPLDDYF